MKSFFFRLFVLFLPFAMVLPAQAAEESFVIASATSTQRFMPLAPVRSGTVPLRADNGLRAAPLRSDRVAMANGFMRIDRATLRPVQSFRGQNISAAKAAEPVTILRPTNTASANDKAITDLFAPASGFNETTGGFSAKVTHAWPLPTTADQRFTSGYGMRRDPFHGKRAFHGGIDLAAAVGTPVLASADGTVSRVETQKGMGKFVAVKHRDGSESYYGQLSSQNVRIGQRVMQGQKVGALGSTGRSTGPHLDYRIKRNGSTFNPMTVLRAPSAINSRVAMR